MEKMVNSKFWKNKKVFITGHTGFKGSWLSLWLNSLGAIVKGYSLNPNSQTNLFDILNLNNLIMSEINDINDYDTLFESVSSFSPEIVFHMAAQPLVLESYQNPILTYQTNVMGTANLLNISKDIHSLKSLIIISSDKCYENNEKGLAFNEDWPMGGDDPYSSSKACTEILVSSFRKSFFDTNKIGLASARAGNVIGGGDWSSNRLIPDILNSVENKSTLKIRNISSSRPWQHVLEPLSGYIKLAEELYKCPNEFSEGWNFGPKPNDIKTVEFILTYLKVHIPEIKWKIDEEKIYHESQHLSLDITKANKKLNWNPTWNVEQAIAKILEWQLSWHKNKKNL